MKNFPRVPYGSTVHGDDEIDAVVKVLKTSTQMGLNVETFEKKISKIFNKKYGVMTNSGTSALFLAIESLNIPEGSEIITPSLTFATTVGCLVKNRLIPVFTDVNLRTFCIDVDAIESKITNKTKAILAPDLLGNLCNWREIREIADKYDLMVFHDSADTLGATLNGLPTGSYTDISITSFYGSHIINGAGNGGMLCTDSEEILNKSKLLRSWGRSSSLFKDSESIENRFKVNLSGIDYDAKFVFEKVGYNLEGNEMGASFGLVQLKNLEKNIKIRQINFKKQQLFFDKYSEFFINPQELKDASTAWLAYPILISENAPFSRKEFQIYLEKRNIQTRVVFTGNILRQPMCKDINKITTKNGYPNSDKIMKKGVLLPVHHGMKESMFDRLHRTIEELISNY